MKQNLSVIFIFQFMFGALSFACYFFTALLCESDLEIIIIASSIISLILSFVLYRVVIFKIINTEGEKTNNTAIWVYFIIVTIISTALSFSDSTLFAVSEQVLQQSYGVTCTIMDWIPADYWDNKEVFALIFFAVSAAENTIKALLLTTKKKKNSK